MLCSITAGRGTMALNRVDGSVAASLPLTAGSVTTWQVNPISLPPVAPESEWTEDDKLNKVRFVSVTSVGSQFLHVRSPVSRRDVALRGWSAMRLAAVVSESRHRERSPGPDRTQPLPLHAV